MGRSYVKEESEDNEKRLLVYETIVSLRSGGISLTVERMMRGNWL